MNSKAMEMTRVASTRVAALRGRHRRLGANRIATGPEIAGCFRSMLVAPLWRDHCRGAAGIASTTLSGTSFVHRVLAVADTMLPEGMKLPTSHWKFVVGTWTLT